MCIRDRETACLPFCFGSVMNSSNKLALLTVVLVGIVSAACTPRHWPTATAPSSTPSASATVQRTAAPLAPMAAPAATEPPSATATPTLAPAAASAVAVAAAVDDEEECRKACHTIDISALFGRGAKHLPANHQGYTTCLECHAALTTPALPATHRGRQDPACPLCHLSK
ncbi:MAG: hypothetical protein N2439_02150, partial [Anaerolineae bacterium]|nr:hypothetical protein [Anaerolineae bacterium]